MEAIPPVSRIGDLPEVISIFPLPGAVLLPRGRLPLHIFEPRYLAMIEDCLKTPERLIGMIQPRGEAGGLPSGPAGAPAVQLIGCAGRLVSFSETDEGRYRITLAGVSRFRVLREVEGFTPYRRVAAGWAGFERDRGGPESDPGLDRERLLALLRRFFTARELATDWATLAAAEDELLINALSTLCPFAPQDRQALLEAPTLVDRRETLMTLIEFALHAGDTSGDPMQ